MPNPIRFYTTGEDYDIFSNVTDIGFTINIGGNNYSPRSSEAVYQGVKALSSPNDKGRAESIFNDTKPPGRHIQEGAQNIQNRAFMHGDLGSASSYLKEDLMYEILLAKFTQNPPLLKALLETGQAQLIENAPHDNFWGIGSDKAIPGRNALGKALMRVRETLQKELDKNGQIAIRTGFSDNLCAQLQINPSTPGQAVKYISRNQLARTPACTTVAAYHEMSRQAHSAAAASASPPAAQQPINNNQNTLKQKLDSNLKIEFNRKGQIQLYFSNDAAANRFKNWCNEQKIFNLWINPKNPNHISLGKTQELSVFNGLRLDNNFSENLRREFTQEAPLPNNAPPPNSSIPQDMPQYRSAVNTMRPQVDSPLQRLKDIVLDQGLKVIVDNNDRIQLYFSSEEAAARFVSNFGNEIIWRRDSQVSLGHNQENSVFKALSLESHNGKPFAEALRLESMNNSSNLRPK
ncbi:MAG: hypothetical protein A3F18_04175 [Legionellales bacterium RIFCSPHIGHO2_12_FULL_37_14]|nr:MAG: hypothetical protein A3F18_04175 [Legionellales bacterium RIFCSPHIGHO2_12_FULL_37_14]